MGYYLDLVFSLKVHSWKAKKWVQFKQSKQKDCSSSDEDSCRTWTNTHTIQSVSLFFSISPESMVCSFDCIGWGSYTAKINSNFFAATSIVGEFRSYQFRFIQVSTLCWCWKDIWLVPNRWSTDTQTMNYQLLLCWYFFPQSPSVSNENRGKRWC